MEKTVVIKKKVFNWIALAGFVFSYFAIFLSPLLIPQIFSLVISIVGYNDAKKCNDRGKIFGLLGLVLSIILIFIWPIMVFLLIKKMIEFTPLIDINSIIEIVELSLKLILSR